MHRLSTWVMLCCWMAGAANAAEPVAELRQHLRQPYASAAERGSVLADCTRRPYSILDLSECLLLAEWRDNDPDESISTVDRKIRDSLLRRFEEAVQEVLATGAAPEKIVVANLVANLGARMTDVDSCRRLGRSLGTSLAALGAEPDALAGDAACRALAAVHPPREIFLPAIQSEAKALDPRRRAAGVAACLERCRETARHARPGLASRGQALSRLEVFEAVQSVVPILAERLDDADPAVRRASMTGMAALAQTVEENLWQAAPQSMTNPERIALEGVRATFARSIPALVRPRNDAEDVVRMLETAEALGRLDARLSAGLEAEGQLEPALVAALPLIAACLVHRDVPVRMAASRFLECLGPAATPCVPALRAALLDANCFVRWSAVRALGKIGVLPENAVLELANRLQDSDLGVRRAAATSLGQLGHGASAAAPALIAAAERSNPIEVRLAVLQALERTGIAAQPSGQAAFTRALTDANTIVREQAVAHFQRASRDNAAPGVLLQPHAAPDLGDLRALTAPTSTEPSEARLATPPSP